MDVSYCFCDDTPGFWDDFHASDKCIGGVGKDPDSWSRRMKEYHIAFWNRTLSCGKTANLSIRDADLYLDDMKLGCDSIIVSFRHKSDQYLIRQVASTIEDWDGFIEDFVRRSYTIGGSMIFPKHPNSLNQQRGMNRRIADRFDLTLECIRRYYLGQDSPLYRYLCNDSEFYDLFVDFRGFVEFFLLQDLVSEDFSHILFWIGNGDFSENPKPNSVEEYLIYLEKEMEFLEKRNRRIALMFDTAQI